MTGADVGRGGRFSGGDKPTSDGIVERRFDMEPNAETTIAIAGPQRAPLMPTLLALQRGVGGAIQRFAAEFKA